MKFPAWCRHTLVLGALTAMTVTSRQHAEARAGADLPYRVAALPAIPFLEIVALGYRPAAADAAWLQAVQYYGEYRQGGNDLSEFRHYVAAVNALDPQFIHPYIFGAVVLATEKQDLQAALDILRRGARANPNSPLCLFEMGFLIFIEGGDLEAALPYLRLSAARPGGRERAQRFMAHVERRLGHTETAWLLWNDIYRETRDPGMRAVAAESLRKLEAELGATPGPAPIPAVAP
jgi:tetratricopeptide (TPR) repeat protein